jgi:hypothetical protein
MMFSLARQIFLIGTSHFSHSERFKGGVDRLDIAKVQSRSIPYLSSRNRKHIFFNLTQDKLDCRKYMLHVSGGKKSS